MEKEPRSEYVGHCLVLAFPAQGHISPALQFSKRLLQKRLRVTLASTIFFFKNLPQNDITSSCNNNNIKLETISDGFDEGGYEEAGSLEAYLDSFRRVGTRTLSELVRRLAISGLPVDCIVYDSHLNWALDVAKGHGLLGATFLTQPCAVDSVYFHAYKKWMKLPLDEDEGKDGISLPGLPLLAPFDLPSFLYKYDEHPTLRDMGLDQFSNIEKADWVLVNSFYELEQEVVEWMKKIWPLKTIGPTVPSMFLDKRIQNDTHYGISMFKPNDETCMKWLNDKPKRSVVYVSFGSFARLSEYQMEEMAWGLRESEYYFLWVVRESEESKLPKDIKEIMSDKGIMVKWCPQLQVLSHEAVGCFVTHCGWNSTLEALCLGIPMVGFPQFADQNTNAKFIKDVWKIGIAAKVDEKGCFTRQEVKDCVKEIMESERGKEMKKNVIYWSNVAKNAADEGGSSDQNIDQFVNGLVHKSQKGTCM